MMRGKVHERRCQLLFDARADRRKRRHIEIGRDSNPDQKLRQEAAPVLARRIFHKDAQLPDLIAILVLLFKRDVLKSGEIGMMAAIVIPRFGVGPPFHHAVGDPAPVLELRDMLKIDCAAVLTR